MSKPSDLLFTGAWMKDADDQLRATFDLGFAAGLEAAAKVCEELDGAKECADAIRALPAAQRGDDTK